MMQQAFLVYLFSKDEFAGSTGSYDSGDDMKKKTANRILFILSAAVFVCAVFYIGFCFYNQFKAEREYETTSAPPVITTQEKNPPVFNPVDFPALVQKNDEIYAWIKIEHTNVDYPIAQHSGEDDFYLTHSAVDKSYLKSGAIYTEKCNAKDFSDPVTLIYGHNNYGDTMFTTLHKFEDEAFFAENEYFYIYMPQRRLTYQMVSAFKYDDRHMMISNAFSDQNRISAFQQMIQNPQSAQKNVRTEPDVPLNEHSRIVVLSTCVTGDKTSRYLVCAVLVSDEKTN